MALPSYLFKLGSGANFQVPDDFESLDPFVSREDGGVGVSDPSQGITGYIWESSYAAGSGSVTLRNLTTSTDYVVRTGLMGLVALSFSFDANMRPILAYVLTDGSSYHYWYDSFVGGYTTTTLPAGATTPKLTHDDKRPFAQLGNSSDVLLFYMLDGVIWCRVQRERFSTDHRIATCSVGSIIKRIGMTSGLRIKLEIDAGYFISAP